MAKTATKEETKETKAKAPRANVGNLVVVNAWEKTFSSGKRGFFGKVQDISTGKKYQIVAAVELAS